MKSMNGEVFEFCGDDIKDADMRVGDLFGTIAATQAPESVDPPKRKRGRPKLPKGVKGKTPKMKVRLPSDASAKEREIQCSFDTVYWVKVKRFKRKPFFGSKANRGAVEYRCRCGTEGNKNYIPNEVCEKHAGSKPK